MRWSKAWFTVVALLGALGVAVGLLVPFLVQREVDRQVARRLSAAAAGADAEVQLHARRWIDAASHAALDEQLAEALDHASTGSANLDLLHTTAQERLRAFQKEWKAWQAIAVDAHGRVMARAGAQEERWKDDLSAAQVVTEALKGFRLDDTWLEDGRLLKVVAAPVTARDRYAGAVVVALDLSSELAQPLADRLGAEVVFVAGGKALGHSAGAPSIDAALAELGKRGGGAEPVPLPSDSGAHAALSRPVAGSVAPSAQVVVVADVPRVASLETLEARLLAAPAQLPWMQLGPVAAALLLVVLLGWYLMGREHGLPLDRLQRAITSVARGDTPRVDDSGLDDRYRAIARTVNGIIERVRGVGRMNSLLDIPAVPKAQPAAVSASIALSPEIPADPLGQPDPLGTYTPLPPPAPAAATPPPPRTPTAPPLASAYGSPGGSPFLSPSAAAFSPPLAAPPPARPAVSDYVPPMAPPPAFAPAPPPRGAGYVPLDPPMAPSGHGVLGSLDEFSGLHPIGAMGPMGPMGPMGDELPSAPPSLGSVPVAAVQQEVSGEAEWQAVFQDFLDTRQRCGEPIEGITFDRFAAKLRGNREQLMSRFGCKGVKFQVYVKDGKAALKATPQS